MDIEQVVEKWEQEKEGNPFDEVMEGVDIFINCVGASKTKDVNHSRIIDLVTNTLLIESAKKHNIKKFILVTSMFVTRPDAMVSFFLNTMVGNCLGHKMQAENILR